MYVCQICAEGTGVFSLVTWWLKKKLKSRSKIAPFSNERHFEMWFQKKIHFSEENYLNYTHKKKKDTILHVTSTFSLKQGETRTSSGPITAPWKEACIIEMIAVTNFIHHLYKTIRFPLKKMLYFLNIVWYHVLSSETSLQWKLALVQFVNSDIIFSSRGTDFPSKFCVFLKSPSVTQRSVSQENAFRKSKNL